MGEAQLRSVVDDGTQPAGASERQGALIVGCNDNVPAIEQAALPCDLHDVEHVGQQRVAPVKRVELAATESPALPRGQYQSVGPQGHVGR